MQKAKDTKQFIHVHSYLLNFAICVSTVFDHYLEQFEIKPRTTVEILIFSTHQHKTQT